MTIFFSKKKITKKLGTFMRDVFDLFFEKNITKKLGTFIRDVFDLFFKKKDHKKTRNIYERCI